MNPKDGQRYVWIPPGSFRMGCSPEDNECAADEKPAHAVTISKGFWLGQTEVTVGAYRRFTQAAGRRMPDEPNWQGRPLNQGWSNEQMPMVNVSWDDAQAYCEWAGGRLPTEAEWEYAARAASTSVRYGTLDQIAWYADNGPHPVGRKQPNGWNLYDMLGNVWEWVADWYAAEYYKQGEERAPLGPPGGKYRALRGGSWISEPGSARASGRSWVVPVLRDFSVGLRCVGE